MKKIIALIVLVSFASACSFPQRRAEINSEADAQIQRLDIECKNNLSNWCQLNYERVEANRTQKMAQVSEDERRGNIWLILVLGLAAITGAVVGGIAANNSNK